MTHRRANAPRAGAGMTYTRLRMHSCGTTRTYACVGAGSYPAPLVQQGERQCSTAHALAWRHQGLGLGLGFAISPWGPGSGARATDSPISSCKLRLQALGSEHSCTVRARLATHTPPRTMVWYKLFVRSRMCVCVYVCSVRRERPSRLSTLGYRSMKVARDGQPSRLLTRRA